MLVFTFAVIGVKDESEKEMRRVPPALDVATRELSDIHGSVELPNKGLELPARKLIFQVPICPTKATWPSVPGALSPISWSVIVSVFVPSKSRNVGTAPARGGRLRAARPMKPTRASRIRWEIMGQA